MHVGESAATVEESPVYVYCKKANHRVGKEV
jgi:hypothetical protein